MEQSERVFGDELFSLSAFNFNSKGFFRPGKHQALFEWCGKDFALDITIDNSGFGMAGLAYYHPVTNALCKHRFSIVPTPCKFGGVRCYFQCPGCRSEEKPGRRVATLYVRGDWLLCRHCANVVYRSKVHPRRKTERGIADYERQD